MNQERETLQMMQKCSNSNSLSTCRMFFQPELCSPEVSLSLPASLDDILSKQK